MKRLKLLLLLLLMCFGIAAAIEPDARTRELMEQTWKEFRQIHPYGFQTVALKHLSKGSIIIASEPPSYVTATSIDSIFKYHGGYSEVKQQKLGHDGWMRDVVGYIPDNVTTAHPFTKDLFMQLYGTDYKAYYTDLDLPSRHVYFVPFEYDLNYTEQLEDLISRWDINDIDFNGESVSSNELFYSEEKGYVAWMIDVKDVENCLVAARQFTLDTDLILGAVCTLDNHLIIIGRERQVPVTIYPPLRPETILLMAQNSGTVFEQYFDTKRATTDADGLYLTPIVISEEVKDSEYGNLLVMCDQMLKSWTENGYNQDVDYQFPAPAYFPFAGDVADGTNIRPEGIYWDQHIVKLEHFEDIFWVLTTDRTGSLPVKFSENTSYLTPDSEKASEYFAELNQPELVRLAQYTMLHDIFNWFYNRFRHHDNPNLLNDIYTPTNPWLKSPSISRSPNKWKQGGMKAQVGKAVGKAIENAAKATANAAKATANAAKTVNPLFLNNWTHNYWKLELLRREMQTSVWLTPVVRIPKVWKPEVWKPKVWKPKEWKPEVWKPKEWKPKGWKPEEWKPKEWKPEGWKPEGWKPEGWKPKSGIHEEQTLEEWILKESALEEGMALGLWNHGLLTTVRRTPIWLAAIRRYYEERTQPILMETPEPINVLPGQTSRVSDFRINSTMFSSLQQDQLKSRGFAPNLHLVKIINELGLIINGLNFKTTRQFGDYIEKAKAENDGKSPINNIKIKGYSANEVDVTVEGQSRGRLEVQKVMDDPLFKSFGFSAPILNKSEFIKEREHRLVHIIIIIDYEPTEERAA